MNIVEGPHSLDIGSSVAVVGNSGRLLDEKLGSDIDNHDTIFRFNAAPIEGYEEHVGSQTTGRILNAITQKGSTCVGTEHTDLEYLQEIFEGDRLMCKRSTREVYDLAKENYEDVAEWVSRLSNDIYYTVRGVLNNTFEMGVRRAKRLSLGVLISIAMTDLADEVHLYGFGFHQEDLGKIHYWETVDRDITSHHNYSFEENVISGLEEKDRVSLIL